MMEDNPIANLKPVKKEEQGEKEKSDYQKRGILRVH